MLTILQNVFWNKCLTDFQDGRIVTCTCLNAAQTWIGFITMKHACMKIAWTRLVVDLPSVCVSLWTTIFSISCDVSSNFAK